MKNKILYFTVTGLLFGYLNIQGQTSMSRYIESVSSNNKTLIASKNYATAKKTDAKTNLTPNNPEFEYGYFPGNSNEIGNKQTIGISQSVDFPTTYIYKNKMSGKTQELADVEFEKTEQLILLNAQKTWCNSVYLNKLSINLQKQESDANQLVNLYIKKQQNGDATQLEVNKAKLFLLDIQNKNRLNQSYIQQNNEQLKLLNGGVVFEVNDTVFEDKEIIEWQTITNELDSLLPELKQNEIENQLANLNLKLNKSAWLPNLTVGYESEEILSNKYSGIRAGITIPLWQNKNTINKAKAEMIFTQSKAESINQQIEGEFHKKYIEAKTLQNNLSEFKSSLTDMNNEYLLSRSLELGQISAIAYFYELDYFYNIMDSMLELELMYQLSLTDLYRYKL